MSCDAELKRLTVYEDDEIRELVVTWEKQDVSTFSDLRLLLQRPDTATPAVLEIVATPVDLSIGRFKFTFAAGDFVEGMSQRGNVRVTNSGSQPLVIAEFLIDVLPRVTP
jgi:hypothetical protein